MADFTIIADTSTALLRLLRENMCPDPVVSPESIMLISPTDKNADYQLGLHLYDVKEMGEYRNTALLNGADNTKSRPPKPLSLSYVLYMNSKAQISAGAEMEQRIFGRAMQTIWDVGRLSLAGINPFISEDEESCVLSILNYSFEEKVKIWSALQSPFQVGAYFTVSPVMLSSRVKERFARVTDMEVQASQISGGGLPEKKG